MPNHLIDQAVINAKQNVLEVFWKDGHRSRVHSCWLRYNCRCEICRKTVVGQHNVNRVDFPDYLTVQSVKIGSSSDELFMTIGGDTKKDHVTYMDSDWLRSMCYCDKCLNDMIKERDLEFHPITTKPTVDYATITSDETKFQIQQFVFEVGFVVITGVPCEEGQVLKVADELGILIETTYGKVSNVYDSPAKSENAANSTIGLPMHTDQCHYEAGPGIQLLHAIQFDECVEGGESQLVDMFQAIECLRQESPDDFRVLTRVPCAFSTIDPKRKSPAYFIIRKPIIEVDYDDQVVAFSWNPGTEEFLRVHEDDVESFYRAYKKLQNIIERKALTFQFRLKSGHLLMINNRRMLHGRSAYRSNGGWRRLQVCYIDSEELRSDYVVLGSKLGKEVKIRKIGNRCAL